MEESIISYFQKLEQTFEELKNKLISLQKNDFKIYYYITREEYIFFPLINIYHNFIGYSYSLEEIERLEKVIKALNLKQCRVEIIYFPIKNGDIFPLKEIELPYEPAISLENNLIKIIILKVAYYSRLPELVKFFELYNSKQNEWFGKVELLLFIKNQDTESYLYYVPGYSQFFYGIEDYSKIGLKYSSYYDVAITILNQNNKVVYSGANPNLNFEQIIEDLIKNKEPVIDCSYHFKGNTIFNDQYKKIISMFKELTLDLNTIGPKSIINAKIINNLCVDNKYNLYELKKPYIEIKGYKEDDESLNTPIEYLAKNYTKKYKYPIDIKIQIKCHYMKQADLLTIENLKCSLCLINSITEKEDYIVCYLCLTQHKQFYLCKNCIHYIIEENLYSIHEHPLLLIPSGGRKYITKMKTFLPVHIYDPTHLYKPLYFDEPKDEEKHCNNCGVLIKYNYWKGCYNYSMLCKFCFLKYKTQKDINDDYFGIQSYPFLRVRQGWVFANYKTFDKKIQ